MSLSASYFLLLICLFIPFLAIRTARVFERKSLDVSRIKLWTNTIVLQVIILFIALFVAHDNYIQLFNHPRLNALHLLAAFGLLAVAAGTTVPRWKATSEKRKQRLFKLVPQKAREVWIWLLISLVAGIGEEIVYRGVTFSILWWWLGSWWVAAILSAVAFALAHAVQGWKSALTIFVLAICLQLLVRLTGTLYLAMAVHFLYDVIAGIIYWQLGKRLVVPAEPAEAAA